MRSNVCKIEKGTADLEAILKESERVASYNGLNRKQTLHLRLLCEEIDGMLPHIIDEFEGKLWIDFEDGVCKVNASVEIPDFNTEKNAELISIAKNKKNAAAVGIVGKIRNAIENFFLDESTAVAFAATFHPSVGVYDNVNYSYLWSLQQYKNTVSQEESEAWDELEKSVIASVADDVIVGVKGKCAEIVIVKDFSAVSENDA